MPRLEIDHSGNIVNTIPSAMTNDLDRMISDLFSQNSWNYVENSKNGAHRDITLTSPSGTVYSMDIFTANVRNESRNDAEKKIQLGGLDPRTYAPKYPLILGVYVSNQADPISEAIIVGYPVRATTNYPSNPSLRSTMVDGILVKAKRNGFCWDNSTKMVAFRPEFIYYYLDNYMVFHEYSPGIVKPHSDTGYISDKKRNLIVFGAPGTGKSHFLEAERKSLITNDDNYERVTFHPDYTYSQFVGAYKPVTDSNGELNFIAKTDRSSTSAWVGDAEGNAIFNCIKSSKTLTVTMSDGSTINFIGS